MFIRALVATGRQGCQLSYVESSLLWQKKLSYGITVHSKGVVHGDLTAVRSCPHLLDVMMTSGMAEQHSNRFELQRPCC